MDTRATGHRERLYREALLLAWITILYNLGEGVVSVFFGIADETITLLGFGVDSFVEVISGVGIWHMVRRIRGNGGRDPDRFERTALRITGTAFYLLALGLLATAAVNLYLDRAPETTFWGVIIALVSISGMWLLIHFKTRVGRALGSDAILADAACSRACMHFSLVLLLASAAYELTGIGGIDSLGAVAIGALAMREGREAFEKARGKACCSNDTCH